MKLARIGDPGAERPVAVTDDGLFDLAPLTEDITPEFIASGGIARVTAAFDGDHLSMVNDQKVRFGPPLARTGKIVCIGLNYSDHAEESSMKIPAEPIIFFKAPNTLVGPNDDVLIPRNSAKTDYEIELAVVIGTRVRYLSMADEALDYVAGFTISNDVSEREFQLERGGQWVKGKSCETFNPLGPWLVTSQDVRDLSDLTLRLWVNGELRQNGTTRDMIFDIPHLITYLSQFMVLEPGDVINTGTPRGVALSADNSFGYLSEGDIMELEIPGMGMQRQVLRQA